MKNIFYLFIILFLCAGCASIPKDNEEENVFVGAMKEIKRDYLKGDEFSPEKVNEAGRRLKYDVLGVTEPALEKKKAKEVLLRAKKTLMTSEYKDNYRLVSGKISKNTGMPDTRDFIFIHFNPIKDKKEANGTTYLVVIHRVYDLIVYSGVFTQPAGDAFYKYADILKEIREQ